MDTVKAVLDKAVLEWDGKAPGKLTCQFNPSELSITKTVKWDTDEGNSKDGKDGGSTPSFNAPKIKFGGGGSAKYTLSLFFDTTEEGQDVRAYTDQLIRLTLRGAGKAKANEPNVTPPTVVFRWGMIRLFKAVVENVKVQYTLFTPGGMPVRAKATVAFIQNDPSEDVAPYQNPTSRSDPRKTYIANAKQRLDQIAYEEYRDARYWRVLAEANNLDDPFDLSDGQILAIHPLD